MSNVILTGQRSITEVHQLIKGTDFERSLCTTLAKLQDDILVLLDYLARAAIIKYLRLTGLNSRIIFSPVLEARSSRSRYWQGWFPSETFLLDLQMAAFLQCTHMVSSLYRFRHIFLVFFHVSKFSCLIRMLLRSNQGLPTRPHIHLITSLRTLSENIVHILRF